jgi:hypothetical protein
MTRKRRMGIWQTPSAKLETRAKVQTLSGIFEARAKCQTPSGKSKGKSQTSSAKSWQALSTICASISLRLITTSEFTLSQSLCTSKKKL